MAQRTVIKGQQENTEVRESLPYKFEFEPLNSNFKIEGECYCAEFFIAFYFLMLWENFVKWTKKGREIEEVIGVSLIIIRLLDL